MTAKDLAPELEGEALDEAAAAEPGRTSAWSALEHRDFRLFWIGLVVSNVGTWMQQFGLGWLVVQLAIKDGSPQLAPFYLGLVGLARAVPGLAFGLFGGVVADRADRRRLLIMTQTSAAIVAGILGVLTITDHINIVEIVLISALNSIIFSFDAPTRQAMVPRLVSDKELMSAIGLNSAAFNGATLVGPLLGGVLIIPFGVGGLMIINAISYISIVVALVLMRPQPVDPVRHLPLIDSIREGISFIRGDPVLRWVVTLSIATALLTRPYIQLLPAEAQFLGVGALELSWLLAASGGGALGHPHRRRRTPRRGRVCPRDPPHAFRRTTHRSRRDALRRPHESRRDDLPGDGEHIDADAHSRRTSRTRHERAHDGVHGIHAAGPDAAWISRHVRRDQQLVPGGRSDRDVTFGICGSSS